jgi:ABC-2 type transport system ATP-binding protein
MDDIPIWEEIKGDLTNAIEIEGLVKNYGDVQALKGLNLGVEPGQVYGFCGPNGAGKTTTLKILVGLVFPTGGSAKISGIDVIENGVEVRRLIGYLPESYGLPRWDTPRKFLTYMGILSGMPKDGRQSIIEEKAKEFGFADLIDRKLSGLSKGNRQKIGIAQALMHDPQVLLLDEPTTGLDPIGRNEVLAHMKSLSKKGKTVLFSTHILSDVEKICDTVGIIHMGSLILEGEPEALKKEHGKKDLDELFLKVAGHEQ